jgi:hypothetical protein
MPSPIFDFFEVIAEELCAEESRVITRPDLLANKEQAPLLDALKREMKASTTEDAIRLCVEALEAHFAERAAKLPFTYDPTSGRFTVVDAEYLKFVVAMASIRSVGKKSKDFELGVLERLKLRAAGSLHRVGHPRDRFPQKHGFNEYLKLLGFQNSVLLGQDKDGGFDILWLLPLGPRSHRPIVSVQCKNGMFNMGEGDKSVGAATRSLAQHGGLQPTVHVPCVMYNDYVTAKLLTPKALNFLPLGLTDLAALSSLITAEAI